MEPKGEVEFWEEFKSAPEDIAFESEQIKASFLNTSVEELNQIKEHAMSKEGKERLTLVKARVNQNIFRKRILSAYNYKCCITGLNIPSLLVAGHIVPWSIDKENRLNPKNGLCINRIHDRLLRTERCG